MNISNPFHHKQFKIYFLIAAGLGLFYFILRLIFYPIDPVFLIFSSVYHQYLILPEQLANLLFKLFNANVIIKDNEFIFGTISEYQSTYSNYIVNWPKYLSYKNWSALLLVLIWIVNGSVRKKVYFTLFFVLTHLLSIVSGLYLLGHLGPVLFEYKPEIHLSSTLIGTFFMFSLLVFWFKSNKNSYQTSLQRFNIHFTLSDRKANEFFLILLIFLVLRSIVIPFFSFPLYVNALLEITQKTSLLFGYAGYIEGDQLIGENAALALAKHCLGFLTMYIFACLIYITRRRIIITGIYIISGIVLLLISNIIRLVAVFIIAQGENGFERATRHHELYNVLVYIFVFVLWILWFEIFQKKKMKSDGAIIPFNGPERKET